ncbi:MAG: N-acetylneuraminate synthase [Candidatus Omnitrophota bacterium]
MLVFLQRGWSEMNKVFVIAEAGVNHNGNIATAKQMIKIAASCGADAIKFQSFIAEKVASSFAPKAQYQKRTVSKVSESQLEMLKKLEIDIDTHIKLLTYCKEKGILFLSSPFDLGSIDVLVKLGLKIFKIPSGEITNYPYLIKLGMLNKKIIMSTGMSDLEDIKCALDILIKAGTLKENITILHCNTEYPTPIKDVNLRAMLTIRDVFGIKVGYSDHTAGIEIAIAAAALGARVIEKHFTLDKTMKGPDHRASLEPHEFETMVEAIRNIEKAMGDGIKKISSSEGKNKPIVRKSIVASRNIEKGDKIREDDITVKRPGTGISPMMWHRVIGTYAKRNFKEDELLEI